MAGGDVSPGIRIVPTAQRAGQVGFEHHAEHVAQCSGPVERHPERTADGAARAVRADQVASAERPALTSGHVRNGDRDPGGVLREVGQPGAEPDVRASSAARAARSCSSRS